MPEACFLRGSEGMPPQKILGALRLHLVQYDVVHITMLILEKKLSEGEKS